MEEDSISILEGQSLVSLLLVRYLPRTVWNSPVHSLKYKWTTSFNFLPINVALRNEMTVVGVRTQELWVNECFVWRPCGRTPWSPTQEKKNRFALFILISYNQLRKGSKDSRIVVKNYETTLNRVEGRDSLVFVRFLLRNCMPELWKTTLKYKNLFSLTSKILGSHMRDFTVLAFSLCVDFFSALDVSVPV